MWIVFLTLYTFFTFPSFPRNILCGFPHYPHDYFHILTLPIISLNFPRSHTISTIYKCSHKSYPHSHRPFHGSSVEIFVTISWHNPAFFHCLKFVFIILYRYIYAEGKCACADFLLLLCLNCSNYTFWENKKCTLYRKNGLKF